MNGKWSGNLACRGEELGDKLVVKKVMHKIDIYNRLENPENE